MFEERSHLQLGSFVQLVFVRLTVPAVNVQPLRSHRQPVFVLQLASARSLVVDPSANWHSFLVGLVLVLPDLLPAGVGDFFEAASSLLVEPEFAVLVLAALGVPVVLADCAAAWSSAAAWSAAACAAAVASVSSKLIQPKLNLA